MIDGYKFFGVPMFMEDVINGLLDRIINGIPDGVDILVTHQPPFGIGDKWNYHHMGDKVLRHRIDELSSLKAHLFGHQHDANSLITLGDVIFSNATVLDNQYNMIALPRLIEV